MKWTFHIIFTSLLSHLPFHLNFLSQRFYKRLKSKYPSLVWWYQKSCHKYFNRAILKQSHFAFTYHRHQFIISSIQVKYTLFFYANTHKTLFNVNILINFMSLLLFSYPVKSNNQKVSVNIYFKIILFLRLCILVGWNNSNILPLCIREN